MQPARPACVITKPDIQPETETLPASDIRKGYA